jgi:hypothetical protein
MEGWEANIKNLDVVRNCIITIGKKTFYTDKI